MFSNEISAGFFLKKESVFVILFMTSCIIQLNDRFLIEMTDKPILDYEKSNYLVVRSMRKGKKRNIKRFIDNKKTIHY